MKIVILTLALLTTAMTDLAANEAQEDAAGGAAMPRSASPDGASVTFDGLEDGDVVPTTFTVRFAISGMGVAPAGTDIENTGHHHLLIDVDEMPLMDQPLPKSDHVRHFGDGSTEVELTLPEGDHSLQLVFADYLHIPHDPVVMSDVIVVTVSADAPPQVLEE